MPPEPVDVDEVDQVTKRLNADLGQVARDSGAQPEAGLVLKAGLTRDHALQRRKGLHDSLSLRPRQARGRGDRRLLDEAGVGRGGQGGGGQGSEVSGFSCPELTPCGLRSELLAVQLEPLRFRVEVLIDSGSTAVLGAPLLKRRGGRGAGCRPLHAFWVDVSGFSCPPLGPCDCEVGEGAQGRKRYSQLGLAFTCRSRALDGADNQAQPAGEVATIAGSTGE